MRVLSIGSLPPEWGGPVRGGAATFHAALLTGLGRRADVDVVGVVPHGPLDRDLPVPVWVQPEGVGRARFYEELLERLRPDVVLMNHIAHTIGVTHARLGSPCPAIGVVHSWHNITFREGEERRGALALAQEALSGLAAAVMPSEHCHREGLSLGLRYPPEAAVIHYPLQPLYLERHLDVAAGPRRDALFVGSLIDRKAPLRLLEAAGESPDLDVTFVGEGELEPAIERRVEELGIGDRARLARLPDDGHLEAVRREMLAAEAMCLPSRSESFGIVFIEALACGTPIVGFGPALREIRDELGIDVGEPLETGEPDEIVAALERVLATDWDRRELRRATLARFGLGRVADRYVALLSRVAIRPGTPPAAPPPPTSPAARRTPWAPAGSAICVLGPSRSGTSLGARLLNLAGVDLGPRGELLGDDVSQLAGEGEEVMARARESNPNGHWEHYRLMRLNERILRTLGGSWREPPPMPPGWESTDEIAALRDEAAAILSESFEGRASWAWKDPRNSLTLPFWQGLLPEMSYVICVRNPAEVADSLQRRDGIAPEQGVRQWLRYLAAALVHTAGRRRLLIGYESYFREPNLTAARLARFAGREGAFDGSVGERTLAGAIDEGLWRSRAGAEAGASDPVSPEARSLFRVAELLAMTGSGGGEAKLNAAADLYAQGLLNRLAEAELAAVC